MLIRQTRLEPGERSMTIQLLFSKLMFRFVENLDFAKFSFTQARKAEVDAQVHVLELEAKLKAERERLAEIRRYNYSNSAEVEEVGQLDISIFYRERMLGGVSPANTPSSQVNFNCAHKQLFGEVNLVMNAWASIYPTKSAAAMMHQG